MMKIQDVCLFMEALPDVSLLVNLKGQIISANRHAVTKLKYSSDKLQRMVVEDLVPERYRGSHAAMRSSFVMSEVQRPMGGEHINYFPARLADDSEIMTEISIGRLTIGENKEQMLLVILIDRTDKFRLEEQLKRRANIDQLTEVYSRSYFLDLFAKEFNRARRYQRQLSLVYFDVDHFKKINDTFGHYVGDLVLRQLGEQCKKTLRKVDICGRLGGEEFAIFLPETELETAVQVAERLRELFTELKIPAEQGDVNFSASFGVAIVDFDQDRDLKTVLKRADAALYQAKNSGRNKVTCAPVYSDNL